MDRKSLWNRYQEHLCPCPTLGLSLDISRRAFDEGFLDRMAPKIDDAFAAVD